MGIGRQTDTWLSCFKYDPLAPLVGGGDEGASLFARRDLLGEDLSPRVLWQTKEPLAILRRQLPDGSWRYPSRPAYPADMDQYETFKQFGILVERYGFDKSHPSIAKAAEYFFSVQTDEGDFRGIYDKQYTPNYTAAIAELLIKAGCADDLRIARVFDWLQTCRQADGGWALPFRTQGFNIGVTYDSPRTIEPDLSKPSSAMVTGVVLRAFAAHPRYRQAEGTRQAGELLLDGLFKADKYPDRRSRDHWLRFAFPYCYTDLISALDSLSFLRFSRQDPRIAPALQWFVDNQLETGTWHFRITAGRNRDVLQLWLALAVCRIFRRFATDPQ